MTTETQTDQATWNPAEAGEGWILTHVGVEHVKVSKSRVDGRVKVTETGYGETGNSKIISPETIFRTELEALEFRRDRWLAEIARIQARVDKMQERIDAIRATHTS